MTIVAVTGDAQALTLRYVPVLAWAFGALAAYGVASVLAQMRAGVLAVGLGSLFALVLLIGFTLFVLATSGQFVVARFDRPADTVRLRRYGVVGVFRAERRLSDLVGLDLRRLRRAHHRIELRFRSGERLPLTQHYVISFNHRSLRRLSALLRIEPTLAEPQRPQV
jgi:hypothetical protein